MPPSGNATNFILFRYTYDFINTDCKQDTTG